MMVNSIPTKKTNAGTFLVILKIIKNKAKITKNNYVNQQSKNIKN